MKACQHQVQYYETDKMGVTHHSNYIRFMEEARVAFLKALGWGYDEMEAQGIVSPVVNISCNYKRSTTFPELIEIFVHVLGLSPSRVKFGYVMTVGKQIVCTAESTHCFLGPGGKPVNVKRLYPDFYASLEGVKEIPVLGEGNI